MNPHPPPRTMSLQLSGGPNGYWVLSLVHAQASLYRAEVGRDGSIPIWVQMSLFSLYSHVTRVNSSSPASSLPPHLLLQPQADRDAVSRTFCLSAVCSVPGANPPHPPGPEPASRLWLRNHHPRPP